MPGPEHPFQRYRPHLLAAGIVPPGTPPGLCDVPTSSPLFAYCRQLCASGGSWLPVPSRVSGYQLASVQAVAHPEDSFVAYTSRQNKLGRLRGSGGTHFNFSTRSFTAAQLNVLSALRDRFQEQEPGRLDLSNTFYCFHGPHREHVESICLNGMVAVRAMDAGYFGSGCYATLNLEYAIRYASGEFDEAHGARRASSPDDLIPVIMLAATVGIAYPITPEADYNGVTNAHSSDFFGRPLRQGFDCHVACVSESAGFQAVSRDQCQYVEVVIDQENGLFPLAVLWFRRQEL